MPCQPKNPFLQVKKSEQKPRGAWSSQKVKFFYVQKVKFFYVQKVKFFYVHPVFPDGH